METEYQFYHKREKELGVNQAQYGSREMQQIRFRTAMENLKMYGLSAHNVMDIGCGTGDFLEFLKKQGWPPWSYWGVDPWAKAIEAAKFQHEVTDRSDILFSPFDIAELMRRMDVGILAEDSYDYVVVLSVFSHRGNWLSELECLFMDTVDLAYRLCKKGCVVTSLSVYKSLPMINEAIFDPLWMYKVGRKLTERVKLDSSYAAHESMLVLFKEKSDFRKEWEKVGGWE